jgi:hypothetical protein
MVVHWKTGAAPWADTVKAASSKPQETVCRGSRFVLAFIFVSPWLKHPDACVSITNDKLERPTRYWAAPTAAGCPFGHTALPTEKACFLTL